MNINIQKKNNKLLTISRNILSIHYLNKDVTNTPALTSNADNKYPPALMVTALHHVHNLVVQEGIFLIFGQ